MHSKSMEYHISSNVDNYAQIPEPRITDASRPAPLIPMDRLSLQIHLPMGFLWSYHPLHRLIVQMAGHISYQPWSRPHQMQGRYEPRRYRLSELHRYHIPHRMPSYAVSRRSRLHSQIMARTLCTLSPYQCISPGSRKQVFRPPCQPAFQEPCPEEPLPYSKCSHPLLLPLHRIHSGSHTEPHSMEASMGLWSMLKYMRPHLLP